MELIEGTFIANERGFGFVKIENQTGDIFISKENSKNAMDGDIVSIILIDRDKSTNDRFNKKRYEKGAISVNNSKGESRKNSHIEGKIVKVIKRKTKQVVGTFKKSRNFGFVIPDDKKIGGDIFISKSSWGKAKTNQKVVVEITKYPEKDRKAEGKIKEILGFKDETGVDMLSIIKSFGLPSEFPQEVLDEAKKVSKEKIVLKGRLDLRKQEMFTIDGEDAKDLDDAVCVNKNDDGTYTLGVHIADVSHFVKEKSNLDKEAIKRGTSVYMLDRVIPMLPKELSNGVCSLNHGEDRYAISCIMTIDKSGKVVDSDIQKSVINVTERMNYHVVFDIIQRRNSKVLKKYEKYINHFDTMKELALILKERRNKEGYLSLDIPESKITLDKFGYPIKIEQYDTNFANEIIEQFMLTANETVAERFYWLNAPFIYRVHDKPEEDKISELNKYLYNFGYRIKGKKDDIKPKAFQQVLDEVKGKDEEKVVSNLILRTLKVARYEAENRGHFGIASKFYCHFTSPIRRYPDLFIHRVISEYLECDYNVDESLKNKYAKQSIKYADISSECELNATKAERESEDMKKAEYMESRIGEEYEGIISSVTNFGFFVELDNTVEGLIRFENLDDDYYIYNDASKSLIGEHTGKVYKLGDKVKVQVISADKDTRRIDFTIVLCN